MAEVKDFGKMRWIILTAFTKERAKEQSARAGEGRGCVLGWRERLTGRPAMQRICGKG